MSRAYAHGVGVAPLLGETIGDNLRRTVERFGERPALRVCWQDYSINYRQLWQESSRLARGLMGAGIAKGDRVGVWSPNRWEWVITQFAAARVGAILVNINPAYKTTELQYVLQQSGTRLLFHARQFRRADYGEMVAAARPHCGALERAVSFDDDAFTALRSGGASDEELAAREASLQLDDPVNIQYTSGTTGFPKGATLTHHNILNNGYFVGEAIGLGEHDRVCIPVPFYHCFGMVMGNLACSSHGALMVVPGESFEASLVLDAIAAERPTALYGVPTMFIALIDHPRFDETDFSSLRTGIMAGSPCPVEVMQTVQSRMHMAGVTIAYGMTETAPVSTQSALDDPLDKRIGTVGRVHPHVEIKIVDAAGALLPRGERGELCTRGYSVMLGYWQDPAATRAAIDEAGWMHTGDLATMDEAGYVNIVGRIKNLIIRGGENVYPREVEEFLHTHPTVSEAQVIGVPSGKYGEELMAWCKPRPGAVLSESELTRYCTGRIATYKIPRYWKFVDEFPMTVTGKVQKYRMRELAAVELGLTAAVGETA